MTHAYLMYVGYLDTNVSEKECELTIVSMLLEASFFVFFLPSMGPSELQYNDLSDISPDVRKRCALGKYISILYETLMNHHEHV